MAEIWQEFEIECYEYLSNKYGRAARFEACGQSDSTRPDVLVIPSHGHSFYMETKSSSAQCGQFVLIPDESREVFDYSPRNPTAFFRSTRVIMDYMDDHFDTFMNAGTAGKNIPLNKDLFYDWIISYYSDKGVRYFITKAYNYLIFPIDRFPEYFDVSCSYRMKRSGSSDPGRANLDEIKAVLSANGIGGTLTFVGKELYLHTLSRVDGLKLRGKSYTYMFRAGVNENYLIRKLSNTCNSNVIFQISLKKSRQDASDLEEFERSL